MKKMIVIAALLLAGAFAASAQNYMVVDSEKVFKSVKAYNDALETLDKLGKQYETQIENSYAEVETMYNTYQNEKAYLSSSVRQQREDAIINKEKQIAARQEEIFGQQGELIKKRVELIKPIQDKVFETINSYAQRGGFQLVLDIASNPMILYYTPSADKTQEIIDMVK